MESPSLPPLLWAGNYYGSRLNQDHYEILTIQHIAPKERAGELDLMQSKWFDYRLMHPMQATYYFVQCYRKAYRDFMHRTMNFEAAPYAKAIKEQDFLLSRERMAFWRLRRTVDKLGVRYDFFLHHAMSRLHIMIGSGKVYAPRPSHLDKDQELLEQVMLAWDDLCAASLQMAQSPCYRVSNFNTGLQFHQRAHERFILEQLKRRKHPHFGLHAAMYMHDLVSFEAAVQEFGVEIVREAAKLVSYD